MLRGGEHGHIHSDFRNDADCGKGLDTRSRHNKVELGKVLFSGSQNKGFQIGLAEIKAVHVGTDDAELFSLFYTYLSVHSGLDLLSGSFDPLVEEGRHVKGFVALQEPGGNGRGSFAENVRKDIVQFDVGNGKAVLCPIFLPCCKISELPAIAHQVPKLADVRGRYKAAGD